MSRFDKLVTKFRDHAAITVFSSAIRPQSLVFTFASRDYVLWCENRWIKCAELFVKMSSAKVLRNSLRNKIAMWSSQQDCGVVFATRLQNNLRYDEGTRENITLLPLIPPASPLGYYFVYAQPRVVSFLRSVFGYVSFFFLFFLYSILVNTFLNRPDLSRPWACSRIVGAIYLYCNEYNGSTSSRGFRSRVSLIEAVDFVLK